MEFMVKRTSDWKNKQPHPKAYLKRYVEIDIREYDEPVKIPRYRGNKKMADSEWFGLGKNHRLIDGKIARDIERKGWFIKINGLKGLIDFQNECGHEIIITDSYESSNIKVLEIHDDYRG